jgi:Tol biopolymer transport system component
MTDRETERLLQAWLDAQRVVPAPEHLRARVVTIPTVVGIPWIERLGRAIGIVPGPRARARRVLALVVLIALVGSLVTAAALSGGPQRLSVVAPTASPSSSTTPRKPNPTPSAEALQPIPSGDTSCVANLLDVVAGGLASSKASTPPLPAGGRVAYVVLGRTDSYGQAFDAEVRVAAAGSLRTVARITSREPFSAGPNGGLGSVSIEGWSADGATLLVWAGRWSPSVWYHECVDLYLVRTDASSVVRLTDNGRPGYSAWNAALAPDGGSAAYMESAAGARSVRISDVSGATTVVDTGSCQINLSELAWSPDERYLAIACGPGVLVYDVAARTARVHDIDAAWTTDRLAWEPDSRRILVATHDPTLRMVALDPLSVSLTALASVPGRRDLSTLAFSPDGTDLLAAGCVAASRTDPACFATEVDLVDVATGSLRVLWSGPEGDGTNSRVTSARWRPDGTIVMDDPPSHTTLVIDPATGKSTRSDWPIDAVFWVAGK